MNLYDLLNFYEFLERKTSRKVHHEIITGVKAVQKCTNKNNTNSYDLVINMLNMPCYE